MLTVICRRTPQIHCNRHGVLCQMFPQDFPEWNCIIFYIIIFDQCLNFVPSSERREWEEAKWGHQVARATHLLRCSMAQTHWLFRMEAVGGRYQSDREKEYCDFEFPIKNTVEHHNFNAGRIFFVLFCNCKQVVTRPIPSKMRWGKKQKNKKCG